MTYDEVLAKQVKTLLEEKPGFTMKKMFGGVGFLLHGNMACGVLKNDLIVRIGPQNYEKYLSFPEAREFDTSGRPMKGWVMVSFEGENKKQDLENWVQRGVDFALGLPPKSKYPL